MAHDLGIIDCQADIVGIARERAHHVGAQAQIDAAIQATGMSGYRQGDGQFAHQDLKSRRGRHGRDRWLDKIMCGANIRPHRKEEQADAPNGMDDRDEQVTGDLFRLSGLSLIYPNGTRALDRVDLSVMQGEFLSLLGPSGCGKSTILRLVAGLIQPTQGQLDWQQPVAQGDIGFVFQEPTLMPWARIIDNVRLPLDLAGVPRAEAQQRAAEGLARVGLGDFLKAFPAELSGGMKMRAALARALVTNPRLLLLDEPFAALDEITRLKLNDDLLALWDRQRFTALFVTHSVFESVYLSGRIAIMGPRPGRMATVMPVSLPWPRDLSVRTSADYGAVCRDVSEELHRAMGAVA